MEAAGDSWQDRAIENLSICSFGRIVWQEIGRLGSLKKEVRACSPLPSLGWLSGVVPIIKGHRH